MTIARTIFGAAMAAGLSTGLAGAAFAQDVAPDAMVGAVPQSEIQALYGADVKAAPVPGEIGLQAPATNLMADLVAMDGLLLVLITAIVVFVTGLMAYVAWRYRASRNPNAARFTHNATVEVIWTAVPVMILVAMAFPSLNLLYKQLEIPEAEVTIKAVGNQWYWEYEYPDYEVDFASLMVGGNYATWEDLEASEAGREEIERWGLTEHLWKLKTDAPVVLPVDTVVRVQTTANDVIHAWTVPSFGTKMDSIPGRLNEFWFQIDEPGTYYGQCSELCGSNHAYMPIEVKAVSREEFDAWVEGERVARGLEPQETRLADTPSPVEAAEAAAAAGAPVDVAAAE